MVGLKNFTSRSVNCGVQEQADRTTQRAGGWDLHGWCRCQLSRELPCGGFFEGRGKLEGYISMGNLETPTQPMANLY